MFKLAIKRNLTTLASVQAPAAYAVQLAPVSSTGVSDQSAQNLCGLLRLLWSESVLGKVRFGVGALYYAERLNCKKTEPLCFPPVLIW